MRRFILAAILVLPTAALAQSGITGTVQSLTSSDAIAKSASEAADTIAGKARQHVLARQMLGQQVTGPGGDVLGTLDNLVVIPGGQVVAVIVKPKQGDPVALPYHALKVSAASAAADSLGLSLPISLEEARGMSALQELTSAVLGQGK